MRKKRWVRKGRGHVFFTMALILFLTASASCGPSDAVRELWDRKQTGNTAEDSASGEMKAPVGESVSGGEKNADAGDGTAGSEKMPGMSGSAGGKAEPADDGAGGTGPDEENADAGGGQMVSSSAGRYVYATLSGEGQKVYDEVLRLLSDHGESVRVSTLDTAVLDEAYKAVMADYGEIFWASGYVYTQYTKGDEMIGLDFAPNYTMTKEEREKIQEQIDGKVEQILAGVPMGASEYDRVRYVFDYLASNIEYVIGSPENQNIISVFVYGQTVCQGYASATQYLLSELGIQSAIVTGEAEGTSHAWNLVRMDGEYYFVDTTWGNSSYAGEDAEMARFTNYNYFGVTSEDIALTHTANDYFVLPDCTAQADNYYVRENLYFTEWNPDAVGALLGEGYATGDTAVSVRFATRELYDQYLQYLIAEEHIADYCAGITSLYYVEDALQRVLIFRFV